MLLSYIDSPSKNYINFFGFHIYLYSLCIVAGIFSGIFLMKCVTYRYVDDRSRFLIDRYFSLDSWLYMTLVLSGIVGGRLYSVLTELSYYRHNPAQILNIRSGGMSIYGAVAAGILTLVVWSKTAGLNRADILKIFDFIAPSIAIAQSIGRFGNYFNNELYGFSTNLPWRLKVYVMQNGSAAKDILGNKIAIGYVHPLFLYELLFTLVVSILLVLFMKYCALHPGVIWFLYVALYNFYRSFLENLRDTDAVMLFHTRINTLVSLLLLYISLYGLIAIERRYHKIDTGN